MALDYSLTWDYYFSFLLLTIAGLFFRFGRHKLHEENLLSDIHTHGCIFLPSEFFHFTNPELGNFFFFPTANSVSTYSICNLFCWILMHVRDQTPDEQIYPEFQISNGATSDSNFQKSKVAYR
ncbi:hypothetical protein L873DRAFT_1050046 [Choiromyces venosus 120613-1]|uniref:Uncharacterized protein n=1 Tax=Choiromyces venosus 120613-1 TaxID=1336337 RepID=A0A3N4JJ86_9PEZI|nr:hypothetical protein L873DRAFT_1050046 [Choiromyces venosus 120613-1]